MTIQTLIPDFDAARQAMVDSQLRPQGVNDRLVLKAMSSVPRELFVPDEARPIAYADRQVPIGDGRTLSPATTIGLLLTEMVPEAGERALVVGAGTGYSAAVLAAMGLETTALECSEGLAAKAKDAGVKVIKGPLDKGNKAGSPYDVILIDGAVEFVPDSLIDQLADGGRLGAGLVERGVTRLIVGRKTPGGFGYRSIADGSIASLPGFTRPREFTF